MNIKQEQTELINQELTHNTFVCERVHGRIFRTAELIFSTELLLTDAFFCLLELSDYFSTLIQLLNSYVVHNLMKMFEGYFPFSISLMAFNFFFLIFSYFR